MRFFRTCKCLSVGMLAVISVLFVWQPAAAAEVPRVSVEKLNDMLGSPDLIVVDARTPGDLKRDAHRIPGSVRGDPREPSSWLPALPKNKTIVLYCA